MMNENANIDPSTNVLTVSSIQSLAYRTNYEHGYPFCQVMDGSYPEYKDTDSLQFAVQWKQGTTESGTSVTRAGRIRRIQGVRPRAAKWSNGTVGGDKSVSCEVGDSPDRCHVCNHRDGLYEHS